MVSGSISPGFLTSAYWGSSICPLVFPWVGFVGGSRGLVDGLGDARGDGRGEVRGEGCGEGCIRGGGLGGRLNDGHGEV